MCFAINSAFANCVHAADQSLKRSVCGSVALRANNRQRVYRLVLRPPLGEVWQKFDFVAIGAKVTHALALGRLGCEQHLISTCVFKQLQL